MRFLLFFFPLFLSAWWSRIFTECDEKEDKTTYKKNKELYISNITSSVDYIKKLLENYKDTVVKLLNGTKKNIFKTEIDVEIKKLNPIFKNIMFNIDFDLIEPLYNENKKKFTHINMGCPTNSYASISTTARQEQVLVTNKIIIYHLMLSYILQLKNNMLSYIEKKNEKEIFNENFYNEVLEPLLKEINPIISNVYENGEGDKNKNGEEKSFFDLLPVMFNFIDKNKFVIGFYNEHIKNENINNEEIINTNENINNEEIINTNEKINNEEIINTNKKINNGINNNKEIKGLLWRIGNNNENIINR